MSRIYAPLHMDIVDLKGKSWSTIEQKSGYLSFCFIQRAGKDRALFVSH